MRIKEIIRGFLAQTHLRYWGIGFILVLFAVLNLVADLSAGPARVVEVHSQQRGSIFQAAFRFQQATPVVEEPFVEQAPTNTPFPEELLANYKQTTGIIIFAGVVVLIIVGGVFSRLLHERDSSS